MPMVDLPGGFKWPHFWFHGQPGTAPSFQSLAITTESQEAWGIVQVPKTGTISKIACGVGTITTGATLDIRLETVSLTTGDPTGTLWAANTNGALVLADTDDNTVPITTLTAGASVTQGDLVAVIIKNPAVSWGSWNAQVSRDSMRRNIVPYSGTRNTAGLYGKSVTLGQLHVAFEYNDGTYVPIAGTHPPAVMSTPVAINTSTTPDVAGMRFQLPFAARVRGCFAYIIGSATDFGIRLATTAYHQANQTGILAGVTTWDATVRQAATAGLSEFDFTSRVELAANTNYRLIFEPLSASNLILYDSAQPSLAIMDAHSGGRNFHLTTAKDPTADGSWTNYNSGTFRMPYMGLVIDGVDAAGAGSGVPNLINGGMVR